MAACTVPKLTGKKLKAAKKGLTRADCKLGKVTKKKGATAKGGKVVKQSPKAGEDWRRGGPNNPPPPGKNVFLTP
jgi:beta-lactam-binding protein with PASTA domain